MRLFPVVLSLCLLAGCAPSHPTTRHDTDLASCRHNADDTMGPVSIDPSDEHNPSPMVMARREELRGQYDNLVTDCMKELPPFVDAPPSGAQPANSPK